jgi:hypothetical protein
MYFTGHTVRAFFLVFFFKDGRRVEDGMYMSRLPLAMRGTESDHKLLPGDFGQDGAAWAAAPVLGGPDDHSWPAPLLLHPCRKIESSFGVATNAGAGSLSIVGRTTDLTLGLTLT